MPQDAKDWFKRSLMYNTPGGKLNRGLSVVDTVEILLCTDTTGMRTRDLTEPEYLKSAILGWCIELVSAASAPAPDAGR